MTIAKTILQQLGGNKFVVMTGSKNFMSNADSLRMDLTRNKASVNRLKISLMPSDTYTMEFYRMAKSKGEYKITRQQIIDDVYCDMLQDVFTAVTGLHTHF